MTEYDREIKLQYERTHDDEYVKGENHNLNKWLGVILVSLLVGLPTFAFGHLLYRIVTLNVEAMIIAGGAIAIVVAGHFFGDRLS